MIGEVDQQVEPTVTVEIARPDEVGGAVMAEIDRQLGELLDATLIPQADGAESRKLAALTSLGRRNRRAVDLQLEAFAAIEVELEARRAEEARALPDETGARFPAMARL